MPVIGGYAKTQCQHEQMELHREYDIQSICNKKLFTKKVFRCIKCKRTFVKLIDTGVLDNDKQDS